MGNPPIGSPPSGGRFGRVLVVVLAAVAIGCRDSSRDSAEKPSDTPVASTVAKIVATPTDEECRRFAAQLGKAIQSGDTLAIDRFIDYDAILESATKGVHGYDRVRREFLIGAKGSVSSGAGLSLLIMRSLAKGGSYHFLRIAAVNGRKCVRFRLLSGNGGLNYHDWILVKDPAGNVRATDVFIHAMGESFAKSIHPLFLTTLVQASKSLPAGLIGSDNDLARHAKDVSDLVASVRSGDYRRALDIHASLPASLQKSKSLLLLREQAASGLNDAPEIADAVADLKQYCPDDPCVAIVSLDYHFLGREYDQALADIVQIDRAVGGDPYLKLLRARIHSARGESEIAERLARKAIQEEPAPR